MAKKNDEDEIAWERSIGWDHPLVKAGLVPGHLLRESFGYAPAAWSEWTNSHQHLCKLLRRRPWFHLESLVAWFADPRNQDDLPSDEPTKTNGRQRAKPAQPRHNPKGVKGGAKPT